MEELFNLLHNFRFNEAIKLSKEIYKPSGKGKCFFITYTDEQLLNITKHISGNDILLNMGFSQNESSIIKTIFCVYFLCPVFNLNDKLSSSISDLESRLKKSSKIKNKDIPIVDLKNLLKGEVVKKYSKIKK